MQSDRAGADNGHMGLARGGRLAATLAAATVFACAAAPVASAGEYAVGATAASPTELVAFDTDAPGTILARVPVGGLLAGETIRGIDFRPTSGELFAVTSILRVLAIDPENGTAQQLGTPLVTNPQYTGASPGGFDFNPAVDRLRLVNGVEDNLRHNPNTFLPVDSDNDATNGSTPDTDLAFDAGDPNAGANPSVVAVAYDRNDNDPATATTLFGIDSGVDALVTVGGVNGIPSPNGGLLFTRGSLGVNVSDLVALDSAPAPGAGVLWAAAQPVGATASTLYTVNALGTAVSRGTIAAPLLGGLSIAPGGGVRVPAALTPVTEAGPAAVVRVERRGDTLAPASVPYRTVDRTAVAGSDYTPVSGTLAFGQGVRSLDVAIPVTQDSAVEGTEVLALQLDKPTGGAVRETQVHSVQIADDDTVPPAPAVIAPDVTAPVFLAAPEVPDSVAALRRAGRLRVSFACSEACTVRFTLSLGRTTVGTALAVLQQPGVRNATLRVSRAGRRALDKARRARSRRKVSLVLRGTATDGAGNVASRRTSLGLLRR
jgi:Domain of unknown function (DUF4394)/Calx-beta domain